MNFTEFKQKYLKTPVVEYPNNRYNKTPLVTVKVVTYNHVGFIEQCLDSILMQKTNFDFEILIAEDDSNDGTRDICKQYADKYPDKIRLLLNSRENNIPINGKPSGTFNNTYANFSINSKYIAIIEGDDYWTDKYSLEKRAEFLEQNNDFVMCFHNATYLSELDNSYRNKTMVSFKTSTEIPVDELINVGIPTATVFYRNNLIEFFNEWMLNVVGGDVILRAKLSHYGKGMFIHDIKNAIYRVHKGGIYSGESLEYQQRNSLKARHYLKSYFIQKDWNVDVINKNYSYLYLHFFMQNLIVNKKIELNFLKESNKYAKLAGHSILKEAPFLFRRCVNYIIRKLKK